MPDKTKKTEEQTEVQETSSVVQNMTTMAEITRAITPEQWAVIKQTIAPSLNEAELRLFLYRAHRLGLDPLAGEIFAYASGEGKYRKLVVIVARDGKRVVAERSKVLKSAWSEAIYRMKDEELKKYVRCEPWEGGELWGATATVVRSDKEDSFVITVPLSEYKGSSPVWTGKPETMIKKVAESQALSMAFPDLSGVYDESERWDEPKQSAQALPAEEAEKPATPAQIENIKNIVGYSKMEANDKDYWDEQLGSMTYGQAAAQTRELMQKGKK